MIHIASPFYTQELRQLIKDLKAENKLREAPLFHLDKFIAKFFIFFGVLFLPLAIWGGLSGKELFVIFLLIIIMIAYSTINHINRIIIPYSIGVPTSGYIETPVKYGARGFVGRGWFFDYRLPGAETASAFKVDHLDRDSMLQPLWRQGQEITILVHPKKPNINYPYFPKMAEIWRLTSDPISL